MDFDSIQSGFNESKEKTKGDINSSSDNLARFLTKTSVNNKKTPFYLDYSWQIYRAVFLLIIFLLFFVFNRLEQYLVVRDFDPFLIKVYKVISFFALINISIYLFMVAFNRYRSTMKGKKGPKGPRGKRGLQGKNSNCDICNKKTYTMKKMYKKIDKPEKVKNEDVVVDMSSPPDKGWRLLETDTNLSGYEANPNNYLNVMDNTYIGTECLSGDNCSEIEQGTIDATENNTYVRQKEIKLQRGNNPDDAVTVIEQRPIIGVAANVNKNKISSLQYFVDNNAKHTKRRYTPELLGDRFGNAKNVGEKNNFICPNNSAIYKVDSLSDSKGIVGLKFHCQDIDTGKEVLVQDKENNKSFGYTFGRNPTEEDKEYFFKSVKCESLQAKNEDPESSQKEVSQFYPTFISEVSGSGNNKVVKNLKFHKCSYYKPG
tara:strand:+ start:1118 stop:2404 length:1287 start_codon:yes stop_codon:yes gene_type:complete